MPFLYSRKHQLSQSRNECLLEINYSRKRTLQLYYLLTWAHDPLVLRIKQNLVCTLTCILLQASFDYFWPQSDICFHTLIQIFSWQWEAGRRKKLLLTRNNKKICRAGKEWPQTQQLVKRRCNYWWKSISGDSQKRARDRRDGWYGKSETKARALLGEIPL